MRFGGCLKKEEDAVFVDQYDSRLVQVTLLGVSSNYDIIACINNSKREI